MTHKNKRAMGVAPQEGSRKRREVFMILLIRRQTKKAENVHGLVLAYNAVRTVNHD